MKNIDEIKTLMQENKNRLLEKHPIKSLAIFGSYAKSKQTEKSDVDVLVEFSKPIGLSFVDLADEIEGFLGLKVDLVSFGALKKNILKRLKMT